MQQQRSTNSTRGRLLSLAACNSSGLARCYSRFLVSNTKWFLQYLIQNLIHWRSKIQNAATAQQSHTPHVVVSCRCVMQLVRTREMTNVRTADEVTPWGLRSASREANQKTKNSSVRQTRRTWTSKQNSFSTTRAGLYSTRPRFDVLWVFMA